MKYIDRRWLIIVALSAMVAVPLIYVIPRTRGSELSVEDTVRVQTAGAMRAPSVSPPEASPATAAAATVLEGTDPTAFKPEAIKVQSVVLNGDPVPDNLATQCSQRDCEVTLQSSRSIADTRMIGRLMAIGNGIRADQLRSIGYQATPLRFSRGDKGQSIVLTLKRIQS